MESYFSARGLREGFAGQLPNLVFRLSCLFRISRMSADEVRGYEKVTSLVEIQDLDRAVLQRLGFLASKKQLFLC